MVDNIVKAGPGCNHNNKRKEASHEMNIPERKKKNPAHRPQVQKKKIEKNETEKHDTHIPCEVGKTRDGSRDVKLSFLSKPFIKKEDRESIEKGKRFVGKYSQAVCQKERGRDENE
jgi:hypothetical protein